jgi:hypothetical protein
LKRQRKGISVADVRQLVPFFIIHFSILCLNVFGSMNYGTDQSYDSSADFWKVMNNGDIVFDGKATVTDEDGNVLFSLADMGISSETMVETALMRLLGLSDNPDNRKLVTDIMYNSGLRPQVDPKDPNNRSEWYWLGEDEPIERWIWDPETTSEFNQGRTIDPMQILAAYNASERSEADYAKVYENVFEGRMDHIRENAWWDKTPALVAVDFKLRGEGTSLNERTFEAIFGKPEEKEIDQKILDSAERHLDEKYIPRDDGKEYWPVTLETPQNQCDDWVEKVLLNAGVTMPTGWRSAQATTVVNQIKYNGHLFQKSPSLGWNILLMQNKDDKYQTGHAALIYLHSNGTMDMYQQGHHSWYSNVQYNYNPEADGSISRDYWNDFYYYSFSR